MKLLEVINNIVIAAYLKADNAVDIAVSDKMNTQEVSLKEYLESIIGNIVKIGGELEMESKESPKFTSEQLWAIKILMDYGLKDTTGAAIEPATKDDFVNALEDGIGKVDAEWEIHRALAEEVDPTTGKNGMVHFYEDYGSVTPMNRYKEVLKTLRRTKEEELDKKAKKYVEISTQNVFPQTIRIDAWLRKEQAQKSKDEEEKALKEIVVEIGGLSAKVKDYEKKIKNLKKEKLEAANKQDGKALATLDRAIKVMEEELEHLRKGQELEKPTIWSLAHRLEGAQLQDIVEAIKRKVMKYLPNIIENDRVIANGDRAQKLDKSGDKDIMTSLTLLTFSEIKLIEVANALTMSLDLNDMLVATELRRFILKKGKLIVDNQVNLEMLRKWADEQKRKTRAIRRAERLMDEAPSKWGLDKYYIIEGFKFTNIQGNVIGENVREETLETWAEKKMKKKLAKGQAIQRTLVQNCTDCTAIFTTVDDERKRCDECEKRIQRKYGENEKLLNHKDLDGNTNWHKERKQEKKENKKACRECGNQFLPAKYYHVVCLDCFQKQKETPLKGAMKNKYYHKCISCDKQLTARDAEFTKCFQCFREEMIEKGKWRGQQGKIGRQIGQRRQQYGGRERYTPNNWKRKEDNKPIIKGNCYVCGKAGHMANQCWHKKGGQGANVSGWNKQEN